MIQNHNTVFGWATAVAVLMTVVHGDLRAASAAAQKCGCGQIEALRAELARAERLRFEHKDKAGELRSRFPGAQGNSAEAFDEYNAWEKSLGGNGPTVGTGPVAAFGYEPRGAAEITDFRSLRRMNDGSLAPYPDRDRFRQREAEWKSRPENAAKNLCDRTDEAKLERFADAVSACAGLRESVIDHENLHKQSCVRQGFFTYWFERGAADLADEEAAAYQGDVNRLSAELRLILRDQSQTRVVTGTDIGTTRSLLAVKAQCRKAWTVVEHDSNGTSVRGASCDGELGPWHIVHTITAGGHRHEFTYDVEFDASRRGRFKMNGKVRWVGSGPIVGPGDVEHRATGDALLTQAGDEFDLWIERHEVRWRCLSCRPQEADVDRPARSSYRIIPATTQCPK